MTLQRVSQAFKDFSMSFQFNPLNDDLIALTNATAIARSIRNIVFTSPGEKVFDPNFGSNVSKLLFEIVDDVSALAIRDEIENSIRNHELRVELIDVIIEPNYDANEFNATILYRIIGIDVPPQQLEFLLLPTR